MLSPLPKRQAVDGGRDHSGIAGSRRNAEHLGQGLIMQLGPTGSGVNLPQAPVIGADHSVTQAHYIVDRKPLAAGLLPGDRICAAV